MMSIAEHVKQASESEEKKKKTEQPDSEDSLFCKTLIDRKKLDSRSRAFVRLGIEQLIFQIEGQGQAMPAMAPAAMSEMGFGGMGVPTA